ncbi:MAG: hypothetical protein LC635_01500 [Pseudonocardiaceae bacterium]|nr:hypothetical protein [Pseudonocardiaceae bacterium]
MSVVAKFRCNTARKAYSATEVHLSAIVGDGDEENETFYDATPNGALTMYVSDERVAGMFEPGKEFYLTFEEA